MSSIAIIGAGISGLVAAHTLQDAGHTVILFEKSRGYGGRAATRTHDGFVYDHGAQYIKGEGAINNNFITERFRTPDLFDITQPVWIFDGSGHIQEGDPHQNAIPKWSYRSGLTTLAKRMAEGLNVQLNTRITHVQQTPTGWLLTDATEQQSGPFAQLLITIPSPQAIDLMQASQLNSALQQTIIANLSAAQYNPLISVTLGYSPTPRKRPYYALVNTDKVHPISWLAWEHEKAPERAPAGTGLLIAQMAPPYSRDHWKQPDEQAVIQNVAQLVTQLIDEELAAPIFTDIQHWLYALPSVKANAETLNAQTLPHKLAFCGDAFVGGRVNLVLEHGVSVAQGIIQSS